MDKLNPAIAANIYKTAQSGLEKPGIAAEADGPSFGDVMTEAVQNSIKTMHAGEKMSAAAVTGNADLTDVVQAVSNAELTLQTVVAIRDRMLGAYQEIMRMPI
jgi:flagellar hook-basal body complex protein FliE